MFVPIVALGFMALTTTTRGEEIAADESAAIDVQAQAQIWFAQIERRDAAQHLSDVEFFAQQTSEFPLAQTLAVHEQTPIALPVAVYSGAAAAAGLAVMAAGRRLLRLVN
jgi:capsid protein